MYCAYLHTPTQPTHTPTQPTQPSHTHTYSYKGLYENSSEFLKLWPGYVYWARGQVKLASNAFIGAIGLLKHGKVTCDLVF